MRSSAPVAIIVICDDQDDRRGVLAAVRSKIAAVRKPRAGLRRTAMQAPVEGRVLGLGEAAFCRRLHEAHHERVPGSGTPLACFRH